MDLDSYGITHNYNLVEKFSRVLRLITGDGFCFRMWGIDRNLALLVCYWVDWKWENFTGNSDIDIVIYILEGMDGDDYDILAGFLRVCIFNCGEKRLTEAHSNFERLIIIFYYRIISG